jgi:hypothetical protein
MKPPAQSPTFLSGLTPLPCLAATLVAAAFVLVNLSDMAISMPYYKYGFPLMYRKQFFRLAGVDEFHPGALGFDIVLAAVATASTFGATRQWSHRIGRFRRFTVRWLMVTVAVFAAVLTLLMATPLLALAVVVGCLLYGFVSIVHVSVMILFHCRARPSVGVVHDRYSPPRRDRYA